MALPNDNPSRPTATNPYFQDNNFAKGIEMRNNNVALWENLNYLNNGKNIDDADTATPVAADLFGFFQSVGAALKKVTFATLSNLINPAGTVIQYAGTTAPAGFLACDGTAVSRTTYATLFSAIGTTYGTGNGSTTFNLPDLRGLFVRGAGAHGTMTKAAGGAFDGGSVGSTSNDSFQEHVHEQKAYTSAGGGGISNAFNGSTVYQVAPANASPTDVSKTDGTNGTPRTGNETKPASMSLLYCIKF